MSQKSRGRLLSRHTLHYLSLGIAGLIFLGSGLAALLADGVAPDSLLSTAGGLMVVTASGYALVRPDASETDVGGLVWFAVLGAVVLLLAVTITVAP